MNKWLFAVLSGVLTINAVQAESCCGYKDYFHLSDAAHPGIYIVGAYSVTTSSVNTRNNFVLPFFFSLI
ncbi:MAG: hypothetical protein ACRC0M_02345 [Legionella sp.]